MLLLKYNDLLLELYEVVKEVKTKEDPNYKFSELFIGLNNLLNLEKICDDYFSRLNDLTDVELNNFNGFASLDAASRKKLEEDYIEAYQKGLIDKKFLNEYPNVTDYVAAIFLNELKDSFFSPLFAKVFNKRIKNTYIEDSTLLNIFKTRSINYKKISQGEDNLGTLFKNVIKEFELLTIIYKANGLNGVVSVEHYDTLLNLADYNEKIVKYDNRLLQMDRYEMYEYIKNHSKDDYISYEDKDSLAGLFLKLQKSKYWFSNQYLTLVLNITGSNSCLYKAFFNEDLAYAAGLFLYYLKDKEFFNAVTEEIDGNTVFRNLDGLIDKISKYKLIVKNEVSNEDIKDVHKGIEKVFQNVKDGVIVLEKNGDNKKL